MEVSLKTSIPWLILAGSGGVADLLSDVLERVSPAPASSGPPAEGEGEGAPSVDMRERVAEYVRMHFPRHDDLDKLVEQVATSPFTYLLNGHIPTQTKRDGPDMDNPKIHVYVSSPGAKYLPLQRPDHCVPRRAGGGG